MLTHPHHDTIARAQAHTEEVKRKKEMRRLGEKKRFGISKHAEPDVICVLREFLVHLTAAELLVFPDIVVSQLFYYYLLKYSITTSWNMELVLV